MDILKTPLVILFEKQNPYRILSRYFNSSTSKQSSHQYIDKNIFIDLYQEKERQCSKDDSINIYHIVEDAMQRELQGSNFEKSIFNLLINYSENILENCGDAVRCKYKDLLKWRMITLKLDQDLFICSFLAFQDLLMQKERIHFDWDTVVKSNNIRLHNMLLKGMSENHFHLKGSAPTFKLNWTSMMNDISCRNNNKGFNNADRLEKDMDGEISIKDSIAVAALLRVILFKAIHEAFNNAKDNELLDILKNIVTPDGKTSRSDISIYSSEIQSEINTLKYLVGTDLTYESRKVKVDYAITNKLDVSDMATRLFVGERSFLYMCFKKVYTNDKGFNDYKDLFYAYLIIKNKIRAELIQENDRVGFSNFSAYQNRKGNYLKPYTLIYDSVEPSAILTSVKNQNLKSLEARVIPSIISSDNINRMINTDNRICNELFNDGNNHWRRGFPEINEELRGECLSIVQKDILYTKEQNKMFEEIKKSFLDKYFYVYHFPKRKDKQETMPKDKIELYLRCRHYESRKYLKEYSFALFNIRERNQKVADRIVGIDACSNEIESRPEVYGQAFRFLKGHLPNSDYKREILNEKSIQKLRATYHVGEDFLDVVDGLRAIDEAITFLGLTHGDRLGHAIVLGINVREWYERKYNRVYLSKQEILDNIAWLISKIKKFNIKAGPDTIDKLLSLYNDYYIDIYIKEDEDDKVVSVDTYIKSWELRGDNPEAYQKDPDENLDIGYWNRCAIRNKVTSRIVKELYYKYHYDPDVKYKGYKKSVFRIEPYMIDAIEEVQKYMQMDVRARGISVETNPSSNVLISTFKKYDKHPILNMYNIGLENTCIERNEVPQLSVSINTDDQGVFDTLLENEFALMSIALEKVKDKYGNPVYNQSQIYDWLDRVRQMGIDQSFRIIDKSR